MMGMDDFDLASKHVLENEAGLRDWLHRSGPHVPRVIHDLNDAEYVEWEQEGAVA